MVPGHNPEVDFAVELNVQSATTWVALRVTVTEVTTSARVGARTVVVG